MAVAILSPLTGDAVVSNEQIIQVFPTVAALELFPTAETSDWTKGDALALTLGGSTKFDGTYGLWAWDPTSTASASATVVLPTAFTTPKAGRWLLIFCECGGRGPT